MKLETYGILIVLALGNSPLLVRLTLYPKGQREEGLLCKPPRGSRLLSCAIDGGLPKARAVCSVERRVVY